MNMQNRKQKGFVSLLAIFFLVIFSVLSVSFLGVTNVSKKTSENHCGMSTAQVAAENGLQYFCYLVKHWPTPSSCYTAYNYVDDDDANAAFLSFAQYVSSSLSGSDILNGENVSYSTTEMTIPSLRLSSAVNTVFNLHCTMGYPDTDSPYHTVAVTSTGTIGDVSRSVSMIFNLRKNADVLEYAVASRGRIWLTGDSTIHGDVYSSWDNTACAPFNMTSDSTVEGTINTVFSKDQAMDASWQMETLDENGDVVYDEDGNPVIGYSDEVQGSHEGINYNISSDVPGMDIDDYNTDIYDVGLSNVPASSETKIEYFPHAAGNYSYPASYSSRKLYRKVYRDMDFSNVKIPYNYNALFVNCTFNDTLFIDCSKSTSSYYNNVRFDSCVFNGPIVTDTPSALKWQYNCLYFTGSAEFNNEAMEEATILAPHFNVNLGNTTPLEMNENELTGAIIGGIVDVRGNANVYGTIISMCDTTSWTSGYVTNIGVSLTDGGSESVEEGDVGTINITPRDDMMLPSGIITPIVIQPDANTYSEES